MPILSWCDRRWRRGTNDVVVTSYTHRVNIGVDRGELMNMSDQRESHVAKHGDRQSIFGLAIVILFLAACSTANSGLVESSPSMTSLSTTAVQDTSANTTVLQMTATSTRPATSLAPTLSPICTSSQLLFRGFADADSASGHYISCADGSSVRRVGIGLGLDPSISPDGTLIAFARGSNIELTDFAGHSSLSLHGEGSVSSPTWSLDGEYIAYILNNASVETIHIATGTHSTALVPTDFEHPDAKSIAVDPMILSVSWSPTGSKILIGTNYSNIYVADITCDSNSHSCVADAPQFGSAGTAGKPSWSPEGTKIVVVCYDVSLAPDAPFNLCIMDAATKLIETIPEVTLGVSDHITDPVWSPDGISIAFGDGGNIHILSLKTLTLFNLMDKIDLVAGTPPEIRWIP